MDQRARRIREIIQDAAGKKGGEGVVQLHPRRSGPLRTPRSAIRWALLLAPLLALPLLLPQHGESGAGSAPRAEAAPPIPQGPTHGLWKFAAAGADADRQAMGAPSAGGKTAPTSGPGGTEGIHTGNLPVF